MAELFQGLTAGEIAFSGPLLIALPLAVLAGIVAFASPCVLPLAPAYLGYVAGPPEILATEQSPQGLPQRLEC